MTKNDCFVVIPFYNEAKGIRQTLDRLAEQTDLDYTLVLVNNNSDDSSLAIIESWRAEHAKPATIVINESQKGTGAAADTGFRYAIAKGATVIARTDADCLPAFDWVRLIKKAFAGGRLEFAIGAAKIRTDDVSLSKSELFFISALIIIASAVGKFLHRGRQYKYGFIVVVGCNIAISADLYQRAGGFPRTRIDQAHEDKVLGENVRMLTKRVRKMDDLIVYTSARRGKRYGYWNTLLWYWDHKYKPQEIDVR